ncbi:MAG: hypothetical protein FWD65_06405 [Coriobacteriia bacterium]|nr:hypothetical protein [Coriobacteriia bacterium]
MARHSRLLATGKLKWFLLVALTLVALVMAVPALASAAPATVGSFLTANGTTYSDSRTYSSRGTTYYKVVLSAPGSIAFKGKATDTSDYQFAYCFDYAIYDSTGTKMVGKPYYYNAFTNTSDYVSYSDSGKVYLNSGTYYIQVGFDTNDYFPPDDSLEVKYDYNLTLTYASATESFPEPYAGNNNTIATAKAISLRTTYRGMFPTGALASGGGTDNQDIYKLSIPYPTQQITIKTVSTAMGYSNYYDYGSLKVTLYNSAGTVIFSGSITPGQDNIDTWILSTANGGLSKVLPAGTYYVGYKAAYDICIGGVYTVNINPLPDAPQITARTNGNGYTTVTWKKVAGVSGYYVYRRLTSTSTYTKIATRTGAATLSYTDKAVTAGKSYYYAIRAYSGTSISGPYYYYTYNRYLAPPKLSSALRYKKGYSYVKVTWAKSTGASRYYVYRKTTGGWVSMGYTTSTSFVDKKAKKGVKYTYAVRAWYQTGSWNACMSTYSNAKAFKP